MKQLVVFGRGASLLLMLAATPLSLHAQQPTVASSQAQYQRVPGEKSAALGAVLSWFVFPGIGSYYAGNAGHGTRHVAIGAASLGGAVALLATCDNDGFCDFDHDQARLTTAIGLGAVFVANAAWSILTAINDAEDHNYRLRMGAVSVAPAVTVVPPLQAGIGGPSLAIRALNVTF